MNAQLPAALVRLFVVGQDAIVLAALREELLGHGYVLCGSAALSAATPDALALDAVRAASPDLLVLDLGALDAEAARRCARDVAAQVSCPLLLVTDRTLPGLLDPQDRPRPIGAVARPLDSGVLQATITLGLRVFHLERALADTTARLEQSTSANERRRAAADQEAEEGYAAFARIGADWFWKTDPAGRFVYFAGGKADTEPLRVDRLGLTRRQAAAQDPENQARIDALDAIVARREPFREFAYRARITDDRSAWCVVSGEPVYGPDGAFLGYRGIGRNVDAEVETRIALQEKTRILDAVFASVPDAMRVLGPDSQTLAVNDQFYALFKFDRAEVEAAPDPVWYTLYEMAKRGEYGPGDPAELARARYGLLSRDGFNYERRLAHGPWIEARGVPLEGGGRLTLYRDITKEKEAQQALLELNATLEQRIEERTAALAASERFNRAIIDAIPARLAVVDASGRIVAVNAAWRQLGDLCKLDQHAHHTAVGPACWHAAGEGDNYLAACERSTGPDAEAAQAVAEASREIVEGRRPSFEVEYRCPTPAGDRSFLCRVARVGADPQGQNGSAALRGPAALDGPVRLVVTHEDVTLVRQVEQQARRAQRMEAIGTLAGGIAHDLNNALTPILMGLDVLRDDVPEHAETIEMMAASASHGAEMLRQLLTFARGAEGRRVAVEPSALLDDVTRIAQSTFPKNIRLRSRVQADMPALYGDPTGLHQVVLNLCVNARDAMPDGGVLTLAADLVTVDEQFARTMSGGRPGEFVRLTIRDTGVGIAAADIERIFDPFFTTKALDRGTGLGLSTALGIVKAHGGFVHVHSLPGRGATFAVYLPTDGVEDAAALSPADEGDIQGHGELLLVVDDEASIRQLYQAVLTRLGFRVLTAADGADALEQIARHERELRAIITDVLMPNVDGVALIHALRARGSGVPVAIASGRVEEWQAEELDQLGIAARLSKPFTQGRLVAVLRQLLGAGQSVSAR